jgi:hypothetical protein
MSQASTDLDWMRTNFKDAVEHLSVDDMKAMLLEVLSTASVGEMTAMVEASSYEDFQNMIWRTL